MAADDDGKVPAAWWQPNWGERRPQEARGAAPRGGWPRRGLQAASSTRRFRLSGEQPCVPAAAAQRRLRAGSCMTAGAGGRSRACRLLHAAPDRRRRCCQAAPGPLAPPAPSISGSVAHALPSVAMVPGCATAVTCSNEEADAGAQARLGQAQLLRGNAAVARRFQRACLGYPACNVVSRCKAMLVRGGGTSAAARSPCSHGLAAHRRAPLTSWHSKPRGLLGPLRCVLLGRWWGCGGGWQVRASGTAGPLTEAVRSLQQPPNTSICGTLVAAIDYSAVCNGRSNSASAAPTACRNWAASRPSAGAGATAAAALHPAGESGKRSVVGMAVGSAGRYMSWLLDARSTPTAPPLRRPGAPAPTASLGGPPWKARRAARRPRLSPLPLPMAPAAEAAPALITGLVLPAGPAMPPAGGRGGSGRGGERRQGRRLQGGAIAPWTGCKQLAGRSHASGRRPGRRVEGLRPCRSLHQAALPDAGQQAAAA